MNNFVPETNAFVTIRKKRRHWDCELSGERKFEKVINVVKGNSGRTCKYGKVTAVTFTPRKMVCATSLV